MPARRRPTTGVSPPSDVADLRPARYFGQMPIDERPQSSLSDTSDGLLIYDGDCGFCTTTANYARRLLPDDVAVEPWQSLDLELYDLTMADVLSAAYFVDQEGTKHRGHMAVGVALGRMPVPFHPAGWLIRNPPVSWLAAVIYDLVARYRFKLPGTCSLD